MDFLINYLETVKGILLSPKSFFDEISWDGGWKESIFFYSVGALVFAFCFSSFATIAISSMAATEPEFFREFSKIGAAFFGITFLGIFLSAMIGAFLISFFTTIILNILGGTGTIQRTYQCLSCAWVVMLIDWIPIIGFIPGMYFFVLAWFGLAKAHDVPGWKGIVALIAGTCILTGFTFAFTLLASTVGIIGHVNENSYSREMEKIMENYRKN